MVTIPKFFQVLFNIWVTLSTGLFISVCLGLFLFVVLCLSSIIYSFNLVYNHIYISVYIYIYIYFELGIYLLRKISNVIDKKNIGLYRDEGLSVIENANGRKLDRLEKDIITIFHNEGLNITMVTNLTTKDFLYVTSNLFTGKYYAFRKLNDRSLNANSNNPTTILKQLPTMVNTRLSSLFINEDEFNKAKFFYEKALKIVVSTRS